MGLYILLVYWNKDVFLVKNIYIFSPLYNICIIDLVLASTNQLKIQKNVTLVGRVNQY